MTSATEITHLTSLELDAIADGRPPSATQSGHLESCSPCRTELDELRASFARFNAQVVERTLPRVQERLLPQLGQKSRWRLIASLLLAPALAAAAFFLLPSLRGDEFGIKGGARSTIYALRGDAVFEVKDGMPLQAGDRLRFELQPAGYSYAMIGSVDAQGQADVVFPLDGARSEAISPRALFTTAGSFELDEACGPERAFVLLSSAPLDATDVKSALLAIGRGGPEAIRHTQALPGVTAGAQLSTYWEKCK